MRIVVAGGSGFLGRPLVNRLAVALHDVVVLTRGPAGPRVGSIRSVTWTPDGEIPPTRAGRAEAGSGRFGDWSTEVDGADAIINLAGEGIADRRWTVARKNVLRRTRMWSTRSLVAAVRAAAVKPPVFLSGSAVGYYGSTGDRTLDESSPPGSDFLAKLCVDWEAEAREAAALGCRVVTLRSGLVLARDGGALKKLLPPFQLYAGGPISSGRQFMSWIHRDDWIEMVMWALDTRAVAGALNATAPNPVTNAEFSRELGRALNRPSWLPVPALALRLLVGEIAPVALVGGQRVMPKRALAHGFTFRYPELAAALAAVLQTDVAAGL